MECQPEAYKTIASEFQSVAAEQGYKAWVGMPEFLFDVPQPLTIDSTVRGMVDKIKQAGWPGDKIYLAAHSLSGVFSQDYARDNKDLVEGAILMGSVLLRKQREIQDDGKTSFKGFDIPVLTLVGEKDGLLRISRGAESFWHQHVNIKDEQKDQFPVVYVDGLSHAGFMDSSMLPSAVVSGDLKPEIEEKTGHNQVANAIVSFIASNHKD